MLQTMWRTTPAQHGLHLHHTPKVRIVVGGQAQHALARRTNSKHWLPQVMGQPPPDDP